MYAAILNNTKDRNPLFQTQNVAKRLVFQRPKRNGYKEKTSLYIYSQEIRENFRTGQQKGREFNYLKLPCPKFKRGQQTANVTARVWSHDSSGRLWSHVFRNKCGSKTPYQLSQNFPIQGCKGSRKVITSLAIVEFSSILMQRQLLSHFVTGYPRISLYTKAQVAIMSLRFWPSQNFPIYQRKGSC